MVKIYMFQSKLLIIRRETHPGNVTRFFSDGAQCLNTSTEKPPVSIPGVAKRTHGPGSLIIDGLNGHTADSIRMVL